MPDDFSIEQVKDYLVRGGSYEKLSPAAQGVLQADYVQRGGDPSRLKAPVAPAAAPESWWDRYTSNVAERWDSAGDGFAKEARDVAALFTEGEPSAASEAGVRGSRGPKSALPEKYPNPAKELLEAGGAALGGAFGAAIAPIGGWADTVVGDEPESLKPDYVLARGLQHFEAEPVEMAQDVAVPILGRRLTEEELHLVFGAGMLVNPALSKVRSAVRSLKPPKPSGLPELLTEIEARHKVTDLLEPRKPKRSIPIEKKGALTPEMAAEVAKVVEKGEMAKAVPVGRRLTGNKPPFVPPPPKVVDVMPVRNVAMRDAIPLEAPPPAPSARLRAAPVEAPPVAPVTPKANPPAALKPAPLPPGSTPKGPGPEVRMSGFNPAKATMDAGRAVTRGLDKAETAFVEKAWKPMLDKAGEQIRKIPGMEKAQAGWNYMMKWEPENISRQYADAVRDMRGGQGLAADDAIFTTRALKTATKDLPTADRVAVRDYMSSRTEALPEHLSHIKQMADDFSAQMRQEAEGSVRRTRRSQEGIDQFKRYLPRIYEVQAEAAGLSSTGRARLRENYLRQEGHLAILKSRTKGEVAEMAARHGGKPPTQKNGRVSIRFETEAQRSAFIEELKTTLRKERVEAGAEFTEAVRGGRVDIADKAAKRKAQSESLSDVLVETKDPLPPEVREMLKEIDDVGDLGAYALGRERAANVTWDFFDTVRRGSDEKGAWAHEVAAGEAVPQGYKVVEGKWAGPLEGKAVRMDIYKDLKGTMGYDKLNVPDYVKAHQFLRGFTHQWKANKTILSPRTALRQFYAAPQFLTAAGINPFNPANLPKIVEGVRSLSRKHPMYRELVENQIIRGTQFADAELAQLESILSSKKPFPERMGEFLANPVVHAGEVGLTKTGKIGKSVQQAAGRGYNVADAAVRATAYIEHRARGMTPRQARAETNAYMQNYAEVGRFTRAIREVPFISPFITFKMESYRIAYNLAKKRPLRAAMTLTYAHQIEAALALLLERMLDDDEVLSDEDRAAIKQQRGGGEMGLWKNKKGQPLSFDSKYIDAWGDLRPRAMPAGTSTAGKVADYARQLVGMDAAPAATIPMAMATGRDQFGRAISPATDDFLESTGAWAKHLGAEVAPTWVPGLGVHWDQLMAAMDGERMSERVPEQTVFQALLSGIGGVNVRALDIPVEQGLVEKQTKRALGELRGAAEDDNERGELDRDAYRKRIKEIVEESREKQGVLRAARGGRKLRATRAEK